jgi:hypothetical protein
VGQSGQRRAGRQLALADFSTLCGLPTTPVGLFNLGSTANLGTGGALTNKGSVTFNVGVEGVGSTAAQFTGATAQSLYISDTGAADPFRILTGSWGAWSKTARRGLIQCIMSKSNNAASAAGTAYTLNANSAGQANVQVSNGTVMTTIVSTISDVCDDRWHHIVATFDGTALRLYVDGVLEQVGNTQIVIQSLAAPFNIGSQGTDGATTGVSPHDGRVDEAFVTPDVLTPDQIRLLYAAKVPHGSVATPARASMSIRRKRRGANWVVSDFPGSAPWRLFDGGSQIDLGGVGTNLQTNNGAPFVAGSDGKGSGGYSFNGTNQSISSSDASMPSGTTARSYGLWLKTSSLTAGTIMGWGTITTADARLTMTAAGLVEARSAGDVMTGTFISDGTWHFVVVTEDNTPVDGYKRKLYVDGRSMATSLTLNSITLGGAGSFRIGGAPDSTNFWAGQVGPSFVMSGVALTQEQIALLYQKSSGGMPTSPVQVNEYIEAMDATNVYFIGDRIESHAAVDLAVAA